MLFHGKNFYDIWFDFGSQKKTIVKNGQNARNFCKKMKFKIRLVAGNGIWSAKIRPEGPLNPLESTCEFYDIISKICEKNLTKQTPPKKKKSIFGEI